MCNKPILLYGAGTQNLRLAYQMIDAAGIPIRYIVDRAKEKQGKSFWGTPIISPEELFSYDKETGEYLLVITVRTEKTIREIMQYLSDLQHGKITTFEQLVIKEKLNSKFIKLNQLQTHVTDHCNLNCIRCSHFAPIAKPFFLDPVEYENNVKRLSELLHGELKEYQLAGGEPLLHPECYKFPYIIRKYFPNTNIVIITNGTLIMQMKNKFFESCRVNRVQVWVTVYPIDLNFDKIKQKLKEESVTFAVGNSGVESGSLKEMWGLAYHLRQSDNGEDNFNKCYSRCFMLRDDRVHICIQGAYSDIVNDYFHLKYPCPAENGVNIYQVKSSQELIQKLRKSIKFCDYCNPFHRQAPIPFRISAKNITEWIASSELSRGE